MKFTARSTAEGSPVAAVDGLFRAASESVPIIEQRMLIAGLPFRLRFAGEAMLERIGGSFRHLVSDQAVAEEELTVEVWDSASTGISAPPLPGAAIQRDATGPIHYYEDAGVRALSRWGTLSVLDVDTRRAWFWTPDQEKLLSWDWASPLRAILQWWLGHRGILQVHGGAVGTEEGGVLVVGRGGSGKSTTTLACLSSGLRYAGDDFVGIAVEPPWVHSLYSSGKLEADHLRRFPRLQLAVANPERRPEEKAIVFAAEASPGVPIAGFPLRAVLVPRVIATDPETRAVPSSPAAALAALAPSTIFQMHPPQENALSRMGLLVRQVPCFSLELGSDISRIPEAILRLLEKV